MTEILFKRKKGKKRAWLNPFVPPCTLQFSTVWRIYVAPSPPPPFPSVSLSFSCTSTRARANAVARAFAFTFTHTIGARVCDATTKRSGCCLRSLIVIQEVARYHLHNTWARTKSCIIPSSLARLRYRFSLYFPFFYPGWKKKHARDLCVSPLFAKVELLANLRQTTASFIYVSFTWAPIDEEIRETDNSDTLLRENSRDLCNQVCRVTCRDTPNSLKWLLRIVVELQTLFFFCCIPIC